MSNSISFDNIDFTPKLSPIAAAIRQEYGDSEMGGGGGGGIFKAIVAVAVAIAIPYFAPQVATSIFGASTMLTKVAAGALMGGAAGALGLTPGGFKQGALMGGFSTGVNTYFGGPTYQSGASDLGSGLSASAPGAGAPVTTSSYTGGMYDIAPVDYSLASGATPVQSLSPTAASGVGETLSTQLPQQGVQVASINPNVYGSGATMTDVPMTLSDAQLYTQAAESGVNTGASTLDGFRGLRTTPSATMDLYGGATSYGVRPPANFELAPNLGPSTPRLGVSAPTTYTGELAARFTDPRRLADMTIMATPQLIGQVYAAQAAKEQEKKLQEYQRQMQAAEGKDEAAYAQAKALYDEAIQSAKNINPNYFAQQAANQANIQGSRRLAESFREGNMAGLRSPTATAAEKRRAQLGISQNVGTAYDVGYGQGLSTQRGALQAAANMAPRTNRGYMNDMTAMSNAYSNIANQRAAIGQGVGQTASYFTYPFLSNYDSRRV